MIKVLKHKGYTCWQSLLTGKCYFFDERGCFKGGIPYFKNIPIPDAIFAIDNVVFERKCIAND